MKWVIRTIIALTVSLLIVTNVHKYGETWEYDSVLCGYQTHATQCLNGKFTIFY